MAAYLRLVKLCISVFCCSILAVSLLGVDKLYAATVENPQSGAIGVEGIIPSAPPTRGATITTPSNGQSFGRNPITVSGLCPDGLLIKVFSNEVFVGSVMCVRGSYSVQIDLFGGQNVLVVRVYDALDQAGPDSNTVTVTLNDAQFNNFGASLMTIFSNFARRGADPGKTLTWPVAINGGTGPYAVSVDWGDGKPPDLISRPTAGPFDLSHIYDEAGVYTIVIRVTDRNGLTAYLQLVGVANGAIGDNKGAGETKVIERVIVIWLPALILIPLLFVSFWLGRKYELSALRRHLERAGQA